MTVEIMDSHKVPVTDPTIRDMILAAAEQGEDHVQTDWGKVLIRSVSRPSGVIEKIEVEI